MDSALEVFATALFAYLVGSIPVAFLVARHVAGRDVREIGEGNAGARNVFHEVGPRWGLATFVGDFSKGVVVAVVFVSAPPAQIAVAGCFVFLGHAFPIWLSFTGGKGLSTVAGFSVVLVPWAAVAAGIASLLTWFATRRFLPTTCAAIVVGIVAAPLLGYPMSATITVIGLFALTGVKRAIDEPRMRRIEASTGWDRTSDSPGTARRTPRGDWGESRG